MFLTVLGCMAVMVVSVGACGGGSDATGDDRLVESRPTGTWRLVADGGTPDRWSLYRADAQTRGSECWSFELTGDPSLPPGAETFGELVHEGKGFSCFESPGLGDDPDGAVLVPFVSGSPNARTHAIAGFVAPEIDAVDVRFEDDKMITAPSEQGWFVVAFPSSYSVVAVSVDLGSRGRIECSVLRLPHEAAGGSMVSCGGSVRAR